MLRCLRNNQTYLLTRRCLGGRFRLIPNRTIRGMFLYCLALAAKRFAIDIHCLCVMSNHYHIVVGCNSLLSDLPGFMHCLNLNAALVLNAHQRRSGTFWEPGSYNLKTLTSEESVLRAMVYVICNPVTAGLIRDPRRWIGFNTRTDNAGNYRCRTWRPNFFGPGSIKPEDVWLQFSKPACFAYLSDSDYHDMLDRAVQARLEEIWAARAAQGLGYLGLAAIRRQTCDQHPDGEGIVNPERAHEEVEYADFHDEEEEQEYRDFCEAHEECMDIVRAGGRPDFPYGTYKMVRKLGFDVVAAPD